MRCIAFFCAVALALIPESRFAMADCSVPAARAALTVNDLGADFSLVWEECRFWSGTPVIREKEGSPYSVYQAHFASSSYSTALEASGIPPETATITDWKEKFPPEVYQAFVHSDWVAIYTGVWYVPQGALTPDGDLSLRPSPRYTIVEATVEDLPWSEESHWWTSHLLYEDQQVVAHSVLLWQDTRRALIVAVGKESALDRKEVERLVKVTAQRLSTIQ